MKILVAVNTLTEVDSAVYSNHCQFWFRLGRSSTHDFILYHPRRTSIDRMRNTAAKVAIENECDYLLFVDDDILIPVNVIDKLIEADGDCVAGWTIIRGYPFKNMFYRYSAELNLVNVKDDELPDGSFTESGGEVISVDAIGFSCCLLKIETLKKVETPYFVTGPYNTEDIYFCVKATRQVENFSIKVHLGVKTSHNLGAEYVDPLNKKAFKTYVETMNPGLLDMVDAKLDPLTPIKEDELKYEQILDQAIFPECSELEPVEDAPK